MIGNRTGWAIAGGLAVLMGVAAWDLVGINRLTPPTPLLTDASAFEPLTTEVPPSAVYAPDTPGDAAALYRRAVADVAAGTFDYAALLNADRPEAIEAAPAVGLLLQAAPLRGDGGLFGVLSADAAAMGTYDASFDDLDRLLLLGRLAGRAGVLRLAKEPQRARPWFEAQFALGARLFGERVRYAEAAAGLDVMREAAAGLRDVAARAGDARRAASLSTFDRSAAGLQARRMQPVWNALGALDGTVINAHAGDVYALCGPQVKERLWRVEAILALGRHRFNAERSADRLAVTRRLDEIERGETDPLVLAAIRAARGLTIEQYRTLR